LSKFLSHTLGQPTIQTALNPHINWETQKRCSRLVKKKLRSWEGRTGKGKVWFGKQ
jgi:hypothetical protein